MIKEKENVYKCTYEYIVEVHPLIKNFSSKFIKDIKGLIKLGELEESINSKKISLDNATKKLVKDLGFKDGEEVSPKDERSKELERKWNLLCKESCELPISNTNFLDEEEFYSGCKAGGFTIGQINILKKILLASKKDEGIK